MPSISVQLPLQIDAQDGYVMNKTMHQAVKQNLKMIILTSPGERVMDPNFGVGLKRFLFEMANEYVYEDIRAAILRQIEIYMPFIKIKNIAIRAPQEGLFESSGVPIAIQLLYQIDGLATQDILEISTAQTI